MAKCFLLLVAALLAVSKVSATPDFSPYRRDPCDGRPCYPATGNILIGREGQVTATSTCGLNDEEDYCVVSHLDERKKCFKCLTNNETSDKPLLNHDISHVINRFAPGTRQRTWWQAANGVENVTIQLDLEGSFDLTHIILVFKTFRPAAMVMEKSNDFGQTWTPYRYFAYDCESSFPGVKRDTPSAIGEAVCESRFSSVAPSTEGEVIFRVIPRAASFNGDKSELRRLLSATNIRINMLELHTLGKSLSENKDEFYYALYEMTVRGACQCNGHASQCFPGPNEGVVNDKIYGICDCKHNTAGRNCDRCESGYYHVPEKEIDDVNVCARCDCKNNPVPECQCQTEIKANVIKN